MIIIMLIIIMIIIMMMMIIVIMIIIMIIIISCCMLVTFSEHVHLCSSPKGCFFSLTARNRGITKGGSQEGATTRSP